MHTAVVPVLNTCKAVSISLTVGSTLIGGVGRRAAVVKLDEGALLQDEAPHCEVAERKVARVVTVCLLAIVALQSYEPSRDIRVASQITPS
jgi:hypothetical protein